MKYFSLQIIVRLLFVIFFVGILISPLVQMFFYPAQIPSLFENRALPATPPLSIWRLLTTPGTGYAKDFEKYFNDNYGFRDGLIKTSNTIDYELFSSSDNVVIGTDNWLEYRTVMERDQILNERVTNAQLQEIAAKFLALNQDLKNRGITLVILPIPNKNSVYPEFFADNPISRPPETAFIKLNNYLKSDPELVYIDAHKLLMDAKKEYVVFPKTDFHWNEVGAYLITNEIVGTIGHISGTGTKFMSPFRPVVVKGGFNGGLKISLGTWKTPADDWILLEKPWKDVEPIIERKLPFSLLIGNSFSANFAELGMNEHFEQLNWQREQDMNFLNYHLRDWPQTKFIIFQYLEVDISTMFAKQSWWPEKII